MSDITPETTPPDVRDWAYFLPVPDDDDPERAIASAIAGWRASAADAGLEPVGDLQADVTKSPVPLEDPNTGEVLPRRTVKIVGRVRPRQPEPVPRPEELSVFQYVSTGWTDGQEPEHVDAVGAGWEAAAREAGWAPYGELDYQIKRTGAYLRWEVTGYVVKQAGVRDVTHRVPVKADGGSLADHRRAAVDGWGALVKAQGLEPHGPLRVKWVPGDVYSGPAWEATGPARPCEQKPYVPTTELGADGPTVIELRKDAATDLWTAWLPGRTDQPSAVAATIEALVTILVQEYKYGPDADVHLAVADENPYAGLRPELCARPVWLGRMPDIGTYDCALPADHDNLCIPSATSVRHQLDRAAQRRAARRAAGSTKWRDR